MSRISIFSGLVDFVAGCFVVRAAVEGNWLASRGAQGISGRGGTVKE